MSKNLTLSALKKAKETFKKRKPRRRLPFSDQNMKSVSFMEDLLQSKEFDFKPLDEDNFDMQQIEILPIEKIPIERNLHTIAEESENTEFDNNGSKQKLSSLLRESTCYGFDEMFFKNGLLKDINYYIAIRSKACDDIKIVYQQSTLVYNDIKTLFTANWTACLTNFLVDYCVQLMINKYATNVGYFYCHETPYFYFDVNSPLDFQTAVIKICNSNITLLPMLHSFHYTLGIIDMQNAMFYYYDSKNALSSAYMLKLFKNRLATCMCNDKLFLESVKKLLNLKAFHTKCNFQPDSTQCGVHVVNNIEKVLKSLPTPKETIKPDMHDEMRADANIVANIGTTFNHSIVENDFDPVSYRKGLLQQILQESYSVENMCPKCGIIEEYGSNNSSSKLKSGSNIIDWVCCDFCKRWWHMKCLKNKYEHGYLPFLCDMCLNINYAF